MTSERGGVAPVTRDPNPWPIQKFELERAYVTEREGSLFVRVNHPDGIREHPAYVERRNNA